MIVVGDVDSGRVGVRFAVVPRDSLPSATIVEEASTPMDRASLAPSSNVAVGDCDLNGLTGVTRCVEALSVRYVRVLELNSAKGMQVDFSYKTSTSKKRETKIGVAYSSDGLSFSASGEQLEQERTSVLNPYHVVGPLHQAVWARYQFANWHYIYCTAQGFCNDWFTWEPVFYTGNGVTNYNSDVGPLGSVIGNVVYVQPKIPAHRATSTQVTELNASNSGMARTEGQYHSYGFSLDVAGFVALTDMATYGEITSVKYTYVGTGCPYRDWIYYDYGKFFANSPQLYAACKPLSPKTP